MVLPFIPNCLIACIIRPVGITNSRHVTEGGGLEPIRDIVTVGRAWYLLLDERVALDLPVRRNCYCMCLGGLWALCVVVNNLNSSDVHAQLFGLNPTYLQFFVKDFGMLKSTACSSVESIHVDSTSRPMIMFKDNRITSNRPVRFFVIHLIHLVIASHGRRTRSIARTQRGWLCSSLGCRSGG